jgi:DNA-binding winged helix-turn-helix (wHTH) protein/tetratricopeptide (TPR) repeat protein
MSSAPADIKHPGKYQFGDFELSPNQGALWRDGVRVPVMPKPMAALIVLVERAGQTVSKDELLDQVWNGAAVEDNNVTQTISTLRKVLGEKRGENRFIVTDPGTGYRFVAAVTRIEATSLAEEEPPVSSSTDLKGVSPRRFSKPLFAFAVLALLALAAGLAFWLRKPAAHSISRKSVAVLSIRDLSKNSSEAWLQTALPEMLTSELASGGKLHAIPADDVVQWRSGLSSVAESGGNAALLRSAHRNFGADDFVLGSYVVTGTCPDCRVRVDLGIFDAHTGESVAAVIDEGSAQDLLDLTTRLGTKLRADLGVVIPRGEPVPWPAPSAMREYAEGLKALQRIDPMAARDHLEAAVTADPGNALIHSALADAWTSLGYAARAGDESRRAYELSSTLSRLDQLGIEARYRANAQQWDRAIEIYQDVFRLFPDSLEDGLNLAQAQFRGMKNAAATSTLRLLRQLPKPSGNDPRIDLLEGRIAGTQSDYLTTRDSARRAVNEAKSRGAMYLYARARLLEGGAMQNLADPDFYQVQTEARKVCEQLGDRQCVSQAWRIRGNERFFAGHFQEAREAYLQGVSVARDLGDRSELANLLNGLGVVAESNLEWNQAEQNFIESIALRKETGYSPSDQEIGLAQLYLRTGRTSDANRTADEAYSDAQKTNEHEAFSQVFLFRSDLARRNGRLDSAQDLSEKALAELRLSKNLALLSGALAEASSIFTARGDLQNAQARLAEAASDIDSVARISPYPQGQGMVDLARAELLLAQGQFERAATEANRSAAHMSDARQPEDSARAYLVAADALDMLGKKSDAAQACANAERQAAQSPDPLSLPSVRLASWRLRDSDANEPADLRSSIARLQNTELSLAEDFTRALRAKRSAAPNARRLFDALADQAATHGYLTLSRRARALGQ